MRPHAPKRIGLVVLLLVASLSLTAFFLSRTIVFAHTAHLQHPHSGSGAVVYTHIATTANSTGNWTELDNKATNSNPKAIVIVTPNRSPASGHQGVVDNHAIGVWYDAMAGRWAIFNQDLAPIPNGAAFNVYAVPGVLDGGTVEAAVIHVATSSNSQANWTEIDDLVTNNNPNAFVNATLNWNPGGKGGVFDNHPIGVWYNNATGRWAIFNEGSMAAIPNGAAFNLLLDTPIVNGVFLHQATASNTTGDHTVINSSFTNGKTGEIVFVTPNFNPAGKGGVYEDHNIGVFYGNGKWAIFNEDGKAMLNQPAFDVLASSPV